MATLQQLERALVGAHEAGDVAAAQALARAIQSARQSSQPAVEPEVEDPGMLQSSLIAAGRTTDRLVKGVKQMGLNVASAFGSDSAKTALDDMARQEKENDVYFERLQKIRPYSTFAGQVAPLAAMPLMGTGLSGAVGSAMLPALVEYGTPDQKLSNAAMGAVGGAAGYGAGAAVSRALQPTSGVSQAQQKALDAADRLGVRLTSGEASGNKALKWAEAASSDVPFASGVASRRATANDQALARAATRAIGNQADEVSENVLAGARQKLSGEFNRILDPLQIDLNTKQFASELKAVQSSKVLKGLRDESIDGLLDEIQAVAKAGPVDGAWFQQNKTALDQAIRAAYNNGQPGKAKALELVDNALDRAAKQSMGKDAGAYDAVRKQWANLRLLETGKVVDDGRVLPGRLKSAMESRYKSAFKEGKIQGELTDIASLANVLRPPPQSGTVPRAFYTGAGVIGALAEPVGTSAAIGLPTALQASTASPLMRNYMTQGLMSLTPEMEALLRAGGGRAGLLGAYGASQ